jgi:hypothetical protein
MQLIVGFKCSESCEFLFFLAETSAIGPRNQAHAKLAVVGLNQIERACGEIEIKHSLPRAVALSQEIDEGESSRTMLGYKLQLLKHLKQKAQYSTSNSMLPMQLLYEARS